MPTRRLMTKELHNARDLGGSPTKNGKTTESPLLWICAALSKYRAVPAI